MHVEYFIDTNVLIYQIEDTPREKSEVANRIIREAVATGSGCISFQVVQECLNTVLRKAEIAMDHDSARSYLETVLTPLFRVPATPALYHRGLDLQVRYRFAFYDALIVAAALEAGCRTLYSEDLQHGQRIEALTIRNPFA